MSEPENAPQAEGAPRWRVPIPHVMALLTIVVGVMSLLSWVIPSGSYQREKVKVGALTKNLVVPDSYTPLEKVRTLGGLVITPDTLGDGQAAPVSLVGFLSATSFGGGGRAPP